MCMCLSHVKHVKITFPLTIHTLLGTHRDDDREPVDLDPGTQCIVKYHPISSLLQSGAVRLL